MANVDTLPEEPAPPHRRGRGRSRRPGAPCVRRAVAAQPPPHREARGGQAVPRRARGSQAHGELARRGSGNGSGCPTGWRTPTGCTSAGSGPSKKVQPPRPAGLGALGVPCCCRNRPSTRTPWPWTAGGGCRGAGWIGNTYLDDFGRDSPASLNSTGDM